MIFLGLHKSEEHTHENHGHKTPLSMLGEKGKQTESHVEIKGTSSSHVWGILASE